MKITDAEYKLLDVIWSNEPVSTKLLIDLCNKRYNWEKSTTYTLLKRLQNKDIVSNNHSIVSSLIKKNNVLNEESSSFIDIKFNGSLLNFVSSFLSTRNITKEEYLELKKMIDNYGDTNK